MKNISTGFGLCVAAAAALAYPFVSGLAPSANASAVTAAAAVSTAAMAQGAPTIVWYQAVGNTDAQTLFRAWSDGRIESTRGYWATEGGGGGPACYVWRPFGPGGPLCGSMWSVISDPAQGLTSRSDINFDEKVDGADLGQLLADWGSAPRQGIPPSDCPLALINP